MASDVDIANAALSHIGADAVVTSLSPPDGSAEAGHCARFYSQARRELLEDQQWAFSKSRIVLASVDNPSTIWQYAYATPSGMINALRVLQLSWIANLAILVPAGSYLDEYADLTLLDDLYSERGSAEFELETTADGTGQILLTNEPNATLLYTRDVTDTTKFSPLFTSAFQMLLAGYIAGPIIKGEEGAKIGAQFRDAAFKMNARAAGSNANSANERAQHVAEAIRARA